MQAYRTPYSRLLSMCFLLAACLQLLGCIKPYELGLEGQWDSREQIGMAEASQVKLRSAQSRVFDTGNSRQILEAVVFTMQDLNFKIQVLDEELGIVSGKFLMLNEYHTVHPELLSSDIPPSELSYILYDDQKLLLFSRNFRRSMGEFWHRDDLVRLTVTVRKRNEKQSVVRASVQYSLKAVENPEPYQKFFQSLEKAMFLDAHTFVEPR